MIAPDDAAVVKEVRDLTAACLAALERGDTAKAEEFRQEALKKGYALRQKWTGVLEA